MSVRCKLDAAGKKTPRTLLWRGAVQAVSDPSPEAATSSREAPDPRPQSRGWRRGKHLGPDRGEGRGGRSPASTSLRQAPPPPPRRGWRRPERGAPRLGVSFPKRLRGVARPGERAVRAAAEPLLEESRTWKEGRLVQQVTAEVAKWIQVNRRARKGSKRKRGEDEVAFQKLLPDQLVLLLESLLEEKTLCPRTLQCLEKMYRLQEQDAEVRHRWCELVVKHKYAAGYGAVEKFLWEDQAMGVYLYGELMVNEDAKQQELAHKCFAAAREQMDMSSAKVVAEMLF